MKPKPFEIIVELTPQCTKTGITYEMHQKSSLIRCKDCKHMRKDCGNVFCEMLEDMFYHYEYEQPINEDFFCAWAERKEE